MVTEFSEFIFVLLLIGAAGLIVLWLMWVGFRLFLGWYRERWLQRVIVSQLAMMARQNLPLATGLSVAADSERGAVRLSMRRISKLLAQGLSLCDSLRLGFPDSSPIVLSLVQVGERMNRLPDALAQAEHFVQQRGRVRVGPSDVVWPYFIAVLFFLVMITWGVMIAVIPRYKEIMVDFGQELPASTQALMNVAEAVEGLGFAWVFVLVLVPTALWLMFRPPRFPRLSPMARAGDWIRWRLPGLRRVEFARGMALMISAMRFGVRGGLELGVAARLASDLDVNAQLRPRMRRFAELLQEGRSAPEASREAELGPVLAVALAGGTRSGNLDAGLRYAADYYASMISRLWIVIERMTWPIATLVLATGVGWVAFALMRPLVTLIGGVIGEPGDWGRI